jgi:hypothetical protein
MVKRVRRRRMVNRFREIHRKYREHTMVPPRVYANNLELAHNFRHVAGCVVECGVWRGGMIAGFADVLGSEREYFLFDSFEGLPPARVEVDGKAAIEYQLGRSPYFHNNCTASLEEATAVMKMSSAKHFSMIKGWFEDTIPNFKPVSKIAILRLDGDWYDSTRICLEHLYPQVADGGIVIFDDYYAWEGCARAVNEFLAQPRPGERVGRIFQFRGRVTHLIKRMLPDPRSSELETAEAAQDIANIYR